MRTLVIAALAVVCAGGAVDAQRRGGDAKAAALKNPVQSTPASITEGRQLYLKNCRHCHGTKALGDGPLAPKNVRPANLIDATWDHGSTDGEIFTVIANGLGTDSPMKGAKPMLNDTQIWNIVNYLRAIGPQAAH